MRFFKILAGQFATAVKMWMPYALAGCLISWATFTGGFLVDQSAPTLDSLAALVTSQQTMLQQQMMTSLQAQMTQLQSRLQEVGHVDVGIMGCGNWSSWTVRADGMKEKVVTHSFSRPYQTPPHIHWGVVDFIQTQQSHVEFHVDLVAVTSSNVTIRCLCPIVSPVDYIEVSWMSAIG